MVDNEDNLREALGVFEDRLILHSLEIKQVLLVSSELLLTFLGEPIAVQPSSVKERQAGRKAVLETRIVENSGPKVLEINVEKMVEIRDNLLESNLILFLVDERLIHGILDEKWNKFSSIHVGFIH